MDNIVDGYHKIEFRNNRDIIMRDMQDIPADDIFEFHEPELLTERIYRMVEIYNIFFYIVISSQDYQMETFFLFLFFFAFFLQAWVFLSERFLPPLRPHS